jgi:hypothetical protein
MNTTTHANQPPATPSPDDIRRQLGWGLVQAARR